MTPEVAEWLATHTPTKCPTAYLIPVPGYERPVGEVVFIEPNPPRTIAEIRAARKERWNRQRQAELAELATKNLNRTPLVKSPPKPKILPGQSRNPNGMPVGRRARSIEEVILKRDGRTYAKIAEQFNVSKSVVAGVAARLFARGRSAIDLS